MSGQVTAAQAPDIETILREHEWKWKAATPQRPVIVCACGDELVPVTSSAVATLDDHRAHLAAVLAAGFVRPEEEREAQACPTCVQAGGPYRCCEHCVDDPAYHAENNRDSHELPCAICVERRSFAAALRPVDAPEGGA